MKTFFLFPLFFYAFLTSPFSLFSQEESSSTHTSLPSSEESLQEPSFRHEIPEMWLDDSYHAPSNNHETDSFQTKFFNMLFILALLIGFMILASWSLKKMMKTKLTNLNTSSYIKVLETRYLSPRATLYLVEIQGKILVIGESPTAMTHLTSFPSEEEKVFKN